MQKNAHMFRCFKAIEEEHYLYRKHPVMLEEEPLFKGLSWDARILYTLMLSRKDISAKNGWLDENGDVYIIYTIEQVMKDLNCWQNKAVSAMKELKDIGLIKTVRRGQGKANLIYVMNFDTKLKYRPNPEKPVNTQNCANNNPEVAEAPVVATPAKPKLPKLQFNNCGDSNGSILTLNKTDITKVCGESCQSQSQSQSQSQNRAVEPQEKPPTTNPPAALKPQPIPRTPQAKYNLEDYKSYERVIKDNIEYDHFSDDMHYDTGFVDSLIGVMLDVIVTDTPTVRIAREEKSREIVRSVYLKLTDCHIQHVISQYNKQRHRITHTAAYLRTMLFTCYFELDPHYSNAVAADSVLRKAS